MKQNERKDRLEASECKLELSYQACGRSAMFDNNKVSRVFAFTWNSIWDR